MASESKGAYRYVVVATLALLYALSFLDRQLMAVLAEPIKQELGLSDTQLGLLTGLAFALFYTAFGVPVAWLADNVSRVRVIAVACTIWSLFSAACGLAGSFTQLALARIGVGIGEAGGSPPSYSIIADYFSKEERGFALSIYTLGVPIGTTAGVALGGWIAAAYGWRTAFIAIGLPGVLVALLILLVVREPERGRFDGLRDVRPPMFEVVRTFFRTPVLLLTAIAAGFSSFVGYAIAGWMPAYLMREKGMTLSDVAAYYSFLAGGATAFGGLMSGYLVDRFGKRDAAAYAIIPGTAMLLALPLFVLALRTPGWTQALLTIACVHMLYITYLAPALTVVQNTVPPAQRSTAAAIFLLVLNLIGLGCGPVYVGIISDWATPTYGKSALGIGLMALAPVFLIAVAAQFMAARAMRRAAPRGVVHGRVADIIENGIREGQA